MRMLKESTRAIPAAMTVLLYISLLLVLAALAPASVSSFPINYPHSKSFKNNVKGINEGLTVPAQVKPSFIVDVHPSILQSKKSSLTDSDLVMIKTAQKDMNVQEDMCMSELDINFPQDEPETTITTLSSPISTSTSTSVPNYSTILTLCFFVATLSALDRVAMSIAILPLSSELHLTETVKGQIASAFSAGYGLAIIPCGLLVSSVSPRIIMAMGVSLWSIGTLLTPWATSFILPIVSDDAQIVVFNGLLPLLLIRGFVGAAESIVLPTIQRFLANWVPSEQKSFAVAIIFAGFQMGAIAAYLLSPYVMDNFGGWRELFYLYGAVGIVWLAPWLIWAQDSPTTTLDDSLNLNLQPSQMDMNIDFDDCKLTNTGGEDDASLVLNCITTPIMEKQIMESGDIMKSANSKEEITTLTVSAQSEVIQILKSAPWNELLKNTGVIAITAAHAANNWGLYNNIAWTPTFYSEQYGLNVRDSAILALIPSIAGAIGGLFSGNLADYMIQQQWFVDINKDGSVDATNIRKGFQGIALLGSSICLAILSSHIPESPSTAQLLLTGTIGLQAFNAAGYGASVQEKAGEKWSGLLYSMTSLPGVIFGTFGVYLTGQILDTTENNWSLVFSCNAGVNVIGALAFLLLYNSKKEFE